MIGKILLIVGGINWFLVGVALLMGNGDNWNVINLLLSPISNTGHLEGLVYVLVGIAAIMKIFGCKCKKCTAGCDSCESGSTDQKM